MNVPNDDGTDPTAMAVPITALDVASMIETLLEPLFTT
jgi:hypothetical protein